MEYEDSIKTKQTRLLIRMNYASVFGVIVTYHPNVGHLEKLIMVLLHQVDRLLIIDNHSQDFSPTDLVPQSPKVEFILNTHNVGLATAYNQACETAKAQGFSHIILFDQDSLPAMNMVQVLYAEICKYNSKELVVAAVGSKYRDIKGQAISPFVRIKGYHLERVDCNENEVVDVDHLISSGSLIDLRALERIGYFTDQLFIDYVDTEWCLRARRHGLRILGVGNAFMDHSIGEEFLNVMGRKLPMHTPLRLQYQFRNQVWLIKQPWVGWRWRIIDSIRCIKLIVVYIFFAPKKLSNLKAIAKGIFQGTTDKMGKI
ncbi:MAG: gt2D [Burkholderiales bacterium]|jgi:rhamnosyltransferase|nr:gt2D [Burkholderiales bacterium]